MSDELDINPEPVADINPVEAPEAPVAETGQKAHPAHEKLLAELPEAWHAKVLPHLQEQDRYYQQEMEKYTPYREFADGGIDVNAIKSSLQLADVAINDPVALYRNLATHLRSQGMLDEAADADDAADQIEADGDADYEIDPAIMAQFQARDELIQQQQDYLQSLEFQAEVMAEQERLESQAKEISSKYEVSDAQLNSMFRILEIQLQENPDADLYSAARELAEITGVRYSARGAAQAEDAPFVVGNTGGAGIPVQQVEIPKDEKAKKAMLAQMFEAQMRGSANSL